MIPNWLVGRLVGANQTWNILCPAVVANSIGEVGSLSLGPYSPLTPCLSFSATQPSSASHSQEDFLHLDNLNCVFCTRCRQFSFGLRFNLRFLSLDLSKTPKYLTMVGNVKTIVRWLLQMVMAFSLAGLKENQDLTAGYVPIHATDGKGALHTLIISKLAIWHHLCIIVFINDRKLCLPKMGCDGGARVLVKQDTHSKSGFEYELNVFLGLDL
jgi:hypothetical protein